MIDLVTMVEYKDGTPCVQYGIHEEEPHVIERFEMWDLSDVYDLLEGKPFKADDMFPFWSVHKTLGLPFDPEVYVKNPTNKINYRDKVIEVKFNRYWLGDMVFPKKYKFKDIDICILVVPWGYDKNIKRYRLAGWVDGRTFRIMNERDQWGRKVVKQSNMWFMRELEGWIDGEARMGTSS